MKELDLKEILLHPVQLSDVIITKLNLNNQKGDPNSTYQVDTKVGWKGELIDNYTGYAFVELMISSTQEDNEVFDICIEFRGTCKLDEDSDIPPEAFEHFLETRCLHLLWPFVRETIPSLSIRMGVKPIDIPTIDVFETLKKVEGNDDGSN